MSIFVCGGLRIDFVITADGEVSLNQIGGNGIYASVGARKFTDRIYLLAKAGENYPQSWLDELADRGIDGSHVIRVPGWQDMRTFYAYVDEKTRDDRDPASHFARVGQPLPKELEGYTFSTYETHDPDNPMVIRIDEIPDIVTDGVHISPQGIAGQLAIAQVFRKNNAQHITLDPGEYDLTPETETDIRSISSMVDAFLPSELELGILLDTSNIYEAAETFASWGTPLVVIKRGPDGCLLYERDANRFTKIPAYPVDVVDVTGAGDSFGGAFTVGMSETGDPVRSALMGAVAASFCLQGFGALYGLDTPRAQALARLEELEQIVRRA